MLEGYCTPYPIAIIRGRHQYAIKHMEVPILEPKVDFREKDVSGKVKSYFINKLFLLLKAILDHKIHAELDIDNSQCYSYHNNSSTYKYKIK